MSNWWMGVLLLGCGCLSGAPITLDFENLSDGTFLTTQYSGLTVSNAIILTSSISLNEFEFPPHSGTNVLGDSTGPITINFTSPISTFAAFFTYSVPLNLKAFSSSHSLLAMAVSSFSSNLTLSGDLGSSPNELLQVMAPGITNIVITGAPQGSSLALDDASFTSGPGTVIPEPATGHVLVGTLTLLWVIRRVISKRQMTVSHGILRTAVLAGSHEFRSPAEWSKRSL